MYSENDVVLYGTQGVCTVCEIVKKKFGEKELDYYLLRPVFDKNSTIFAPCNGPATVTKMRGLMPKTEIVEMIKEVSSKACVWIDDTGERRRIFSEILHSGDSKKILSLAKSIAKRREELHSKGKNLSGFDERFLKEAEKVTFEEIAVSLDIEPANVLSFIKSYSADKHKQQRAVN